MKVVFVNTLDSNIPSGGAKQAYRHIDVLNQLGIDACFAHPTPDFRYTWFDNKTVTMHTDDVELTGDDFIIYGELVHEVPRVKGWDRCGQVILCQNDYNALGGFKLDLRNIRQHYREAAGVLCPSENSKNNLQFMFPSARVMRFRYSFDREPWVFCEQKEKYLAVMPRKRADTIQALIAVTEVKWVPPGWKLIRIDKGTESQVADMLRRSAAFLSLSEKEGFGMPPAEAMACGCVVIGYTGYAGSEYMLPGISFPVADGDFIDLTRMTLKVFAMPEEELREIGHKASTFIRATYSTKAEVESIKTAWEKITRPVIEIRTTARERMKKEVAAYMPVYNEGPYMETLLKWLVPRVGAIFVAESIIPWSPGAKPGGESKAVVDKVIEDMPEAAKVIRYLKVGDDFDKDKPLLREAKQRNYVLERIREEGFKFVWMVEADEFYRDSEAECLWDWFFERVTAGARAASCKWQTYWRSVHWRIDPPENFRPNVAFLSDCSFHHGRVLSIPDEKESVEVPDRICVVRHYSWARTPEDVRKKLSAWGHSKETNPEWYEKVFMSWKPGDAVFNVHPTTPENYKTIVRCDLPVPEAMVGHPFVDREIIDDDGQEIVRKVVVENTVPVKVWKKRVKAVIMNHNRPENADRLYDQLAPVFDDVEIFDNGSDANKIPIHMTRSRENVYWTGTWNEVMATCQDYDAVWVLGCDLELKSTPEEYREAIESALPFGCWSPCIEGRAHPFMQERHYADKKPVSVRNIEGMALAMSGSLMRHVGELVPGSTIGFGQDFWLCYRSRKAGMRNIIDGRVKVYHPEGIGYDEDEAHRQMDETFGKVYGPDFRQTIFEYDQRFEYNVAGEMDMTEEKKFTIVTVDNGWGLSEFIRITSKIANSRRIVMRKGVIEGVPAPDVEFVPYDESLEEVIRDADVAFFPRVGVANKEDYLRLLKVGIPTVVREACSQNAVEHMKNGWLFRDEQWATHWLSFLKDNPKERDRVRKEAAGKIVAEVRVEPKADPKVEIKADPKVEVSTISGRTVSVITPTYKRDPEVIRRCIGSMLLQTDPNWEQLVCSDGELEVHVRDLVRSIGDPRVRYYHTVGKKEGDFGNTVRSEMLKVARGTYVMFFDDDNVILPNYMDEMLSSIALGFDVAICHIMHFGPLNEKEVGKAPKVLTGDPVKLYHIDPLQVVVRREVMKEIGWDTTVGYLSDGVTLEKLAARKIVRVDKVLGVHM